MAAAVLLPDATLGVAGSGVGVVVEEAPVDVVHLPQELVPESAIQLPVLHAVRDLLTELERLFSPTVQTKNHRAKVGSCKLETVDPASSSIPPGAQSLAFWAHHQRVPGVPVHCRHIRACVYATEKERMILVVAVCDDKPFALLGAVRDGFVRQAICTLPVAVSMKAKVEPSDSRIAQICYYIFELRKRDVVRLEN
eukprot:CAMPEP_0177598930 /NCGR_PEP_ID=MMETSP0419_2-20121207/12681_1 /TAXON_ID=582737 /ORGANISM="Tetraselmis sp., Strain GSL018" /LENGTH=195 /DNA_ID=CAMNT_0019091547 /DNA_START=552 /DNA_END=1140 /DNA_ORIENTATION=-